MKKIIILIFIVLFLVSCKSGPSDEEVENALAELSDEELQELSEIDFDEFLIKENKGKFYNFGRSMISNSNFFSKLSKEMGVRRILKEELMLVDNSVGMNEKIVDLNVNKLIKKTEEIENNIKYLCVDNDKEEKDNSVVKSSTVQTTLEGPMIHDYNVKTDFCNGDILIEHYCSKENKLASEKINCIPETVEDNGCFEFNFYGGCDEGICMIEIDSEKCIE